MISRKHFADVQWWNSSDVYVLCRFCSKVHRHSFSSSYDYDYSHRVSHCAPRTEFDSYYFKYPFSESAEFTKYEVDKINKYYVTVGAKPPFVKDEALNRALTTLKLERDSVITLPKWEDGHEIIVVDDSDPTYKMKRIDFIMSRMLWDGDLDLLREYLDTSSESELFIHGIDQAGKTALLFVACERYPEIVRLLLERGADPNFEKEQGRTPLMEAALWGRYGNVGHLLGHGANKQITDKDGMKAIDLAGPSERNEEERYYRSGGENQIYREVTHIANRERKMIVALLTDDAGNDKPDDRNARPKDTFFLKTSNGVKLLAPITEYETPNEWKTIARLQRRDPYPPIDAMSGWSHEGSVAIASGKDWTPEVMEIAGVVGHRLTPDQRDHGMVGGFNACHAEKQLVAYFISKHVLLKTETRAPRKGI